MKIVNLFLPYQSTTTRWNKLSAILTPKKSSDKNIISPSDYLIYVPFILSYLNVEMFIKSEGNKPHGRKTNQSVLKMLKALAKF